MYSPVLSSEAMLGAYISLSEFAIQPLAWNIYAGYAGRLDFSNRITMQLVARIERHSPVLSSLGYTRSLDFS